MIKKLPISACIIVKNEENHIAKCIQSLKQFVKEINVVDTGSTDRTIEIAGGEKVRVHHYQWNDNFAEARNYAISVATEPYILVIDADEALDQNSLKYLEKYTERLSNEPATVHIRSVIDDHRTVNSRITRLFPNSKDYRYKGVIHEQLYYKDRPIALIQPTEVVLHHYGYNDTEIAKKQKIERNLALLRKQMEAEPNMIYLRYQMGQTYYVNGEFEKAIQYFDDTLQMVSELDSMPRYMSTVFLSYGYCLLNLGEYTFLDNLINDAIGFYPDFTDLYFLYGVSLIERQDVSKLMDIKETFEYCLRLGEVNNHSYETVEGVGSYRALYNLGVFYEVTNNLKLAIEYYDRSAVYKFGPALLKTNQFKDEFK